MTTPAFVRLRRWMLEHALSQTRAAERVGLRRDQFNPIVLGLKPPTREIAERIQRETADAPGGPIRVSDWPALRDATRSGST